MVQLYGPETYWATEDRDKECNGCGPEGLIGAVIPDTIYGLSITPACNIHDWMYMHGATIADKEEADRVFFNNMLRIIDSRPGRIMQWLRSRRSMLYYRAVRDFGGPWFWQGKNRKTELGNVAI